MWCFHLKSKYIRINQHTPIHRVSFEEERLIHENVNLSLSAFSPEKVIRTKHFHTYGVKCKSQQKGSEREEIQKKRRKWQRGNGEREITLWCGLLSHNFFLRRFMQQATNCCAFAFQFFSLVYFFKDDKNHIAHTGRESTKNIKWTIYNIINIYTMNMKEMSPQSTVDTHSQIPHNHLLFKRKIESVCLFTRLLAISNSDVFWVF